MKSFYRQLLPLFFVSLLLSACNDESDTTTTSTNDATITTTTDESATPETTETVPSEANIETDEPPQVDSTNEATIEENTPNTNEDEKNSMTQVKLETNFGDIVIELNAEKAPLSVANFIAYAEKGAYNGTIFHRVIKDFMIQGGGFNEEFVQQPTEAAIKNEANNGLQNVKGSVAMARTGDPHSATSQFFINTVDNSFLDFKAENQQGWGYAVFGQVTEGMDVVEKIRAVATGNKNGHGDVPNDNVIITTATIVK